MKATNATDKNVSDADVEIEPRTRRALEEYMTVVPEDVTGLVNVYTESGSEYVVDAEDGACTCPDVRHNLGHDEACKHQRRCRFALGLDAVPSDAVEALDVDPSLGKHTDAELRFATADGGIVEAGDDAEILKEEDDEDEEDTDTVEEDETTGVRNPYAHRDEEDVDTTPLGTVNDGEEDVEECEECAGLSGMPCFECYMEERGHEV